MGSMNFIFSNNKSTLTADFFPPIELGDVKHEIALVECLTYNTIPNINANNNKITYYKNTYFEGRAAGTGEEEKPATVKRSILCGEMCKEEEEEGVRDKRSRHWGDMYDEEKKEDKKIIPLETGENPFDLQTYHLQMPSGAYELSDIERYLQENIDKGIKLSVDKVLMKVKLFTPVILDFTDPKSLADLLGLKHDTYQQGTHVGEKQINILPINAIRVQCSIVEGSYINGKITHTIHEFYPSVPAGYKIIEIPKNLIYLPVNVKRIDRIIVSLVDQHENLIDFMGEDITLRLHLRAQN